MRKILAAMVFALAPLPVQAQLQTTLQPAMPALPQAGQSADDPDAIICRSPEQLPGKRLYGPKVCKPQRQWDDLHRQGLDIGPDGQSVVASEKYRTTHGCNSGLAC